MLAPPLKLLGGGLAPPGPPLFLRLCYVHAGEAKLLYKEFLPVFKGHYNNIESCEVNDVLINQAPRL